MARTQRRIPRRPRRELAQRILVVTEGTQTEPQYIDGLQNHLRSKGATATVKAVTVGQDPIKVIQKCIEIREKGKKSGEGYDTCVCLVDVDEHANLSEARKKTEQESILLLISNLKFEVWLLWHKEDKTAALSGKELDRRVAQLKLVEKKRLTKDFPFDAVDRAYDSARRVDPELTPGRQGPTPSSAMPILVDLMRGKPIE